MSSIADPPRLQQRVLSTLNPDGTRRWLRPRVSAGAYLTWRRIVAYALVIVFTVMPYLRLNGKPPILLDIPGREFTFFGATFLPTDTLLLALLLLAIFIGVFLLTALLGRVWCGWGCPQTVYMEFFYRPVERLFEGKNYRSGGKSPAHPLRRAGKYSVYLLLSMFLAHTFLAYFVGVDRLYQWVQGSPFEHPTAFIVMAVTTALMMLDFCYLREQVCTLMCPYGRIQSVLLDRQSLIISYDEKRGEPRGRLKRGQQPGEKGDCIDCGMCVTTCPTGIDIREGLQMECIGCAQCIDACDAVMDKVGTPRGLIRYSSQEAMATGARRLLRPRVIVYPALLLVILSLFGMALAGQTDMEVSFLRTRARPYVVLDSGDVSNIVLLKITNRGDEAHTYAIELLGDGGALTSSDLPMTVDAGGSGSATLHVTLPRQRFDGGRAEITLRVSDGQDCSESYAHHVLGPLFGGGG